MSRYCFVLEFPQGPPPDHVAQAIGDLITMGAAKIVGSTPMRFYCGEVESETLLTDPSELASDKQRWFLGKLTSEAEAKCLETVGSEQGDRLAQACLAAFQLRDRGSITKSEASQMIDILKGALDA